MNTEVMEDLRMRDHTKLEAFALADELALLVYAVTADFPRAENYGLTSQLRRAAVSIAANIVEASARPTRADYVRMLSMAYGSARELEYELSLATRLRYMREEDGVHHLAVRTSKALRALISALRRQGPFPARAHRPEPS
jgi:four helix bundle protein